MSALISKETDNRVFISHNDGFLDIFVGLGILFAGLFLWTGMVWLAAIFIPVFLPSFQAARKRFLEPRTGGLVNNSQLKTQNQNIFFSVVMLMGVLLLGGISIFFVFDLMSGPVNIWLQKYILLVLGLIFASVWIFAGAMFKIPRFYFFAGLTFTAFASVQFLTLPFWLALLIIGGVVVFAGLLVFIRFVQQNPIVDKFS